MSKVYAAVKDQNTGTVSEHRFDSLPRVGEFLRVCNDFWVVVAVIHETSDGEAYLLVEKADKPQ